MSQQWTPTSRLAKAVCAAGFEYDDEQDIIVSRMDAWQREVGFCFAYDAITPALRFIIDCEPLFLTHGGKEWMIELWKGQYCLETGGEIGVYNRPVDISDAEKRCYERRDRTLGRRPHDPANGKFFDCVRDPDRLDMEFVLYRDDVELFRRKGRHWWLTGFRWGVHSDPEQLKMRATISFPDPEMCALFVAQLARAGHDILERDDTSVEFLFARPASWQPREAAVARPIVEVGRARNEALVESYGRLGLSSNDPNTIPADVANGLGIGQLFERLERRAHSRRVCASQRERGASVTEVAGLLQCDRLTAREAAALLREAGYGYSDVAVALRTVFRQSPRQTATAIHRVGASYQQIARALRSAFKSPIGMVGKILVQLGAGRDEVREALVAVFQPERKELLELLGELF